MTIGFSSRLLLFVAAATAFFSSLDLVAAENRLLFIIDGDAHREVIEAEIEPNLHGDFSAPPLYETVDKTTQQLAAGIRGATSNGARVVVMPSHVEKGQAVVDAVGSGTAKLVVLDLGLYDNIPAASPPTPAAGTPTISLDFTYAGFLMGVLVKEQTATNQFAVINDIPDRHARQFHSGFVSGALKSCESCKIAAKFIPNVCQDANVVLSIMADIWNGSDAGLDNTDILVLPCRSQAFVDDVASKIAAIAPSRRLTTFCAFCKGGTYINYSSSWVADGETLTANDVFPPPLSFVTEKRWSAGRNSALNTGCLRSPTCIVKPKAKNAVKRAWSDYLQVYPTAGNELLSSENDKRDVIPRLGTENVLPFALHNGGNWSMGPNTLLESNAQFLAKEDSSRCSALVINPVQLGSKWSVYLVNCFSTVILLPPVIVDGLVGGNIINDSNATYFPLSQTLTAIDAMRFVSFGGQLSEGSTLVRTNRLFLITQIYGPQSCRVAVQVLQGLAAVEGSPEPRSEHAAAFSAAKDALYIHGGLDKGGRQLGDVWKCTMVRYDGYSAPTACQWAMLDGVINQRTAAGHTMLLVDTFVAGVEPPEQLVELTIQGGTGVGKLDEWWSFVDITNASHWVDGKLMFTPSSETFSQRMCALRGDGVSGIFSVTQEGKMCLYQSQAEKWFCPKNNTGLCTGGNATCSATGRKDLCIPYGGPEGLNSLVISHIVDPNLSLHTESFVVHIHELPSDDLEVALANNLAQKEDRSGVLICGEGFFTVGVGCWPCSQPATVNHNITLADLSRAAHCEEDAESKLSTTVVALLAAAAFVAGVCVALGIWLASTRSVNDADPGNAPKSGSIAIMCISIADSHVFWRNNPSDFSEVYDQFSSILSLSVAKHKGYRVKNLGETTMIATADVGTAFDIVSSLLEALRKVSWKASIGRRLELKIAVDFCTPVVVDDGVVGVDYAGPQALVAAMLANAITASSIAITKPAADMVTSLWPGLSKVAQLQPELRGHAYYLTTVGEFADFLCSGTVIISAPPSVGGNSGGNSASSAHAEDNKRAQLEQFVNNNSTQDAMPSITFLDTSSVNGQVSSSEFQSMKMIVVDILRATLQPFSKEEKLHYTKLLMRRYAIADTKQEFMRRGLKNNSNGISLSNLNLIGGRLLQTMDPLEVRALVQQLHTAKEQIDSNSGNGGMSFDEEEESEEKTRKGSSESSAHTAYVGSASAIGMELVSSPATVPITTPSDQ